MKYLHRENGCKIRVYNYVDPRFTLEDMFAKIKLFAEKKKAKIENHRIGKPQTR